MPAFAIGVLIMAHAADYATFIAMISRNGISAELNPIVAQIHSEYGLALLTVAKFAAVLLVASTFLVLLRSHRRVASTVMTIGVFIGVIGAYSNILTI